MNKCPVIFLAFANDHQSYLYKLTEEQNAIRRALKPMQDQGLCKIIYETDTDLNKIWDSFNEYRDRIVIFHYGGHAEDYRLLLQQSNGERQFAQGEGLVPFLSQQKGLQLVFINGCSSRRQAEDLRDAGIPAVIGTSEPINDEAAAILSEAFYRGLAAGRSLEQAWRLAKSRVLTQKKAEGFQRGIKLGNSPTQYAQHFPWDLYIRPGAENVQEWNLPHAANNPLFGLPLPEEAFLRLPGAPFVGLHYFREEDAAIFHGRGAQIRELYNHLQGVHPIILLYGKSGVGKSSMLDAGLLPRIKHRYALTYARRIQERGLLGTLDLALDELLGPAATDATTTAEAALRRKKAREHLRQATDYINEGPLRQQIEALLNKLDLPSVAMTGILEKWRVIEQQSGKPLVVILDQVEEKFTRPMPATGEDELLAFLLAILPLFAPQGNDIQGKLILSYRKEYHPEIRDIFRQLKLPFSELFLKRLDRQGIIEGVRGITHQDRVVDQQIHHHTKYNPFRLELENGPQGNLAEIIADDLLEDSESPIAPVLQIILDKLWQTAVKTEGAPVKLTIRQYRELRKQGTTMNEFFQEQMAKLAEQQPEAVQSGLVLDLLYAHTTRIGTAGSCLRETLYRQYEIDNSQIQAILQQLEQLSLLVRIDTRRQGESGDQNYTTLLSHDTLAPVVIREYNTSDRPGQRVTRILDNKLADIGFKLPPTYLDGLKQVGIKETHIEELAKPYIGHDKFKAALRTALTEEVMAEQWPSIAEQVMISLRPNGEEIYLEKSDLAIVEQGTGLDGSSFPGRRRLSRAEQLLVAHSQQRARQQLERERHRARVEQAVIAEKRATEQRAARRQRIFSVVIGVAFLIALGLGLWALQQQGIAEERAAEAQERLAQFQSAEFEKIKAEIDDILERADKLGGNYPEQQQQLLIMARDRLRESENPLLEPLKIKVSEKLQNLRQ